MKRFVTGVLLAALAAGCAHYPLNDKLARADITTGYPEFDHLLALYTSAH